jgi:curved DNA-binding protein CbpA
VAYLKLAKEAHPDVGGSTEVWHAVHEAYTVLSDASLRSQYDAMHQGYKAQFVFSHGFGYFARDPKLPFRYRKDAGAILDDMYITAWVYGIQEAAQALGYRGEFNVIFMEPMIKGRVLPWKQMLELPLNTWPTKKMLDYFAFSLVLAGVSLVLQGKSTGCTF